MSKQHTNLVANHTPPRCVRKVEVVIVADEGLWVALGQVGDQLSVCRAWAIGLHGRHLHPVRGLEPLDVLRQALGPLKTSAAKGGI